MRTSSSFLVCTEILGRLDTYGLVVQDRPRDLYYIFKYIILLGLTKMHMDVIPGGLQVKSKTKKLQHTRKIPSVELTCVDRSASSGCEVAKNQKMRID